jgi:Zincin-like metallopeptidase
MTFAATTRLLNAFGQGFAQVESKSASRRPESCWRPHRWSISRHWWKLFCARSRQRWQTGRPAMSKITAEHLARCAIRQSTADQLTHNQESQGRQYGLANRAGQLGWASPLPCPTSGASSMRSTGSLPRPAPSSVTAARALSDHVQMPPFETFRDAEGYAATRAHELTHDVERIMPWGRRPGLATPRAGGAIGRHIQSVSRKARSRSSGRYRPTGRAGAAIRWSAVPSVSCRRAGRPGSSPRIRGQARARSPTDRARRAQV